MDSDSNAKNRAANTAPEHRVIDSETYANDQGERPSGFLLLKAFGEELLKPNWEVEMADASYFFSLASPPPTSWLFTGEPPRAHRFWQSP